jgi:FAD-dependent sensor of blue light
MILIRLTYFSRNRLDRFNGPMEDRVAELLATAVANNLRDDVTGALVYDPKWFAQILEGSENVVSRTFERILRDQRHADVSLVAMQPITERRFAGVPMAGLVQSEDNADLFRHYGGSRHFDPQLMRAERLFDLIEALEDRTLEDRRPRSATTAA